MGPSEARGAGPEAPQGPGLGSGPDTPPQPRLAAAQRCFLGNGEEPKSFTLVAHVLRFSDTGVINKVEARVKPYLTYLKSKTDSTNHVIYNLCLLVPKDALSDDKVKKAALPRRHL